MSTPTGRTASLSNIDHRADADRRVFAPDFGIVSDAGKALKLLLDVATEWKSAGKLRDWSGWARECGERKRTMLRKTHFDQTPLKPQRVYEEMNKAFGRDTCYVTTIGLSQIAGAQFLHIQTPAQLDKLRTGWPARMDPACGSGRPRRRS
jgi:glyoxylate carboligase